uniref:Uncharacterized protein n=1 Tax=Glossina morsitans morsitans TaxID=37546 RepID=A0A905AWD5_GLOMM
MEIIGLQALLTLVFLLVLLENNCHGGRSLHYCANWSPSPFDGNGHYIYLLGSPPDGPNPCIKPGYDDNGYFVWLHGYLKNGYAYRDNGQSSGTHPCRSVRIDNRRGHYFSVSGFPSEDAKTSQCIMVGPAGTTGYYVWNHTSDIRDSECADWMPGYDGKRGHYEHKKGQPPKDPCVKPDHDKSGYYIWRHGFLRLNRSRLMRNSCWVYKFSSNDGYYISEGGETPREGTCALTGPMNSTGHYIWTHASYAGQHRKVWGLDKEYCADWEPGYDGKQGAYNWHQGPTPQDDPCVRYAGNEKPGQNGTGGYYRWEHGYVTLNTTKRTPAPMDGGGECISLEIQSRDGVYTSSASTELSKDKCILLGPHGSKGSYSWSRDASTAKDCASWEPGYDGSEGHYTSVNDSDDPCTKSDSHGGYLLWHHGALPGGKLTRRDLYVCTEHIYYNKDGYYISEYTYKDGSPPKDKCILVHPDEKGYYIWNHFELPKYLQPDQEGSPVALPRLLEDNMIRLGIREWHFNITASSTSIDVSSVNTFVFISISSALLGAADDFKCISG